jgi:hypothetical protein
MPSLRRALLAFATVAVLTGAVAHAAASGTPDSVDGAAGATAVAVRGQRTQVETQPSTPSSGGCLIGTGAKVSASIDPAQRWYVDVVSSQWYYWKVSYYPQSGARGAVAVVGDSLTVASSEETMRGLIDAGFGPVCIDGQVSRRVSVYTSNIPSGVQEVARIKSSAQLWGSSNVRWVLALGTNDDRADTSAYAATIQKGRNAVGTVTVPMYWIDIRTRLGDPYTNYENQWNARLPGPNTVIIGWAAAVAPSPSRYINGDDMIHLTAAGEVLRGDTTVAALLAT